MPGRVKSTAPNRVVRDAPMGPPFRWIGGKRRVASTIWDRLGRDVGVYVEPFAGSLAVLLGRGRVGKIEWVNDLDGYVANFWRAAQAGEVRVDYPASELCQIARSNFLAKEREHLTERLRNDPYFFDAELASWWAWGVRQWMGRGFAIGSTAKSKFPECYENKAVDLSVLTGRLRSVRIACGDWRRVVRPKMLNLRKTVAVYLDPPYQGKNTHYAAPGGISVAQDVLDWAIEHGDNPRLRIAMSCYTGDVEMPSSWSVVEWQSISYYGKQTGEQIWFSPHCLAAV